MGFFNSILFIILSINLYQSILDLHTVAAKDVLVPADEINSLDPTSNLVSTNGKFTFGFSKFNSSTNFTYLGIWYTNFNIDQPIWVANDAIPMIGDAVLKIDHSGTLKVVNGRGITLFNIFYNHDVGIELGNMTRGVLEDSGNFLFYDENNPILWQSFDHPINILIPGMKLGYHSINSSSFLLSASGNFTLGFPTFLDSTNFTYLGIWDRVNMVPVWIANRDIPMIGDEVLKIDDSGTLKVVNGNGVTVFNIFYNQNGTISNKTRAVLEDNGNFVVYDDESNRMLWQSFDHPTDILITGMKLGYNLTTKQNWTLTSWVSDYVPAIGPFTMRLEQYQNSPQLLIYRRGVLYWASGPWMDGAFQYIRYTDSYDDPPHLSLISDASGMYITCQTTQNTLRLAPEGQLQDFMLELVSTEFCYGYDSDDGCVVSAGVPNCRGQSDSYLLKLGNWINGGPPIHNYNSSINLNDCMEGCWNECDCAGFIITMSSTGTECMTWRKNDTHMQFGEDPSGQVQQYVLVSPKPVSPKPPKIKTWMWIVIPLSGVLTSILAAYLCYVMMRRRIVECSVMIPRRIVECYVMIRRRVVEEKEKRSKDDLIHQLTVSNSFNFGDELEKGIKDAPNVKVFSLKAILAATNNFSDENKLGQGGYGPVYKGKLFDSREIAVKRLSKTSGQGIEEFKSELILISKLQHTNLVRLYGCCIHQEEKMLIYEFMPNKSLDFFLFDEDKREEIDWQMRFNIIEGITQGLLYLHKYSRMKVIHRDLKVSNILLDVNMNPKIADFGLARIFKPNVAEAVTNRVVGTYGYIAPEYAMRGTFSTKSDVFSFGVLILEIVSGKKNSSFNNYDRILNLMGYTWELWNRDAALELKDEALGECYDVKQLLRSIHVGLLCVQENADDRPTMTEVAYMLNNDTADLPVPKQPAFYIGTQRVETSLQGKSVVASVNGLTLTVMGPR